MIGSYEDIGKFIPNIFNDPKYKFFWIFMYILDCDEEWNLQDFSININEALTSGLKQP
jgi:hypothetical protein